jgi:hypothetical protein
MRSTEQVGLAIAAVSAAALGFAAQAATLGVPGDYPTIQAAIDAAVAGDEVLVEPGIYSETIDFLGKDIVVRSAMGPGKTILDGTGLDSSLVRCVSGEPSTAKLAGFTLRKGWSGSPLPANETVMIGGGLAVSNASPTIENCRFINNRTYYGGGAYFYQSESSVIDCVFHQNRAYADGGGAQVFGGNVVFDGCTFTYNLAVNSHGGGAHVTQGSATFVDSSLSNNTANIGGGITFYATGGLVTLDGCEIDGNIAAIAGGFWVRPGFSDFLLIDTEICANAPTPFVGRYTDGGGNVFCSGCRGDLNSDGQVNSLDIGILLGFWGFPGVGIPVAADLNNDAVVDAADLSILLGNWGACIAP